MRRDCKHFVSPCQIKKGCNCKSNKRYVQGVKCKIFKTVTEKTCDTCRRYTNG